MHLDMDVTIAVKSSVMPELCKVDFPNVASRVGNDESEVGPDAVSRSLLVTVQPKHATCEADASRHARQDLSTVFTTDMYSCLGPRRELQKMHIQLGPQHRPFAPPSAAPARHVRLD